MPGLWLPLGDPQTSVQIGPSSRALICLHVLKDAMNVCLMMAELFILNLDTETPWAKHTEESNWNSATY